MSWDQYLKDYILESKAMGHEWKGMCESGGILDINTGAPWTSGFNMGSAQVESDGKKITVDQGANLVDAFKQPSGNTSKPGGIYLNGIKYITVSKDDNRMILKKNGGGATVARSNKALVVATWSQKNKGKADGKEKAQNTGDCTTIVEELANYLKSVGY